MVTVHRKSARLFSLSLFAAIALFPACAMAQTADETIAKYLTARGGLAKIKAVQSERVSGTISFGPGADGPFFVDRKRPLKMHMEITIGTNLLIRAYDGKAGWIYNPFPPTPGLQPMSDTDLRNIADEADFEGPFVDYKAKGNKMEAAGKEDVDGKQCNKIKMTNKNGETSYFLFDVATGLLSKWEGDRQVGDKVVPWESHFRDFREVDGLKYPFLIESNATGTDLIQRISADKIEVNIPMDEALFGKPNVPAPPPAAPAKP
jgi:outer membrane lipoprotein-sorting protein